MSLFLTFIVSLIFASCVLVVGVQNPIHSILILILVFFFGSVLLFVLQVEYFALLFMIVYVGAIVVLFLFIVMLLEVKIINVVDRFRDLFSFKNLFLGLLLLEVLLFLNEGFFDLIPVLMVSEENFFDALAETNLYVSQNKFLSRNDQLWAIGGVLFTEYGTSVMLAGLLLFLSMVGSIVMTLDSNAVLVVKAQDANSQALRNPGMGINSWRII